MSNTSEVTPFESTEIRTPEPIADPVALWLEERMANAVTEHRERSRRERLGHTALPLRLKKPATLLKSAEALGYKLQPLSARADTVYLLERGADRIAIVAGPSGGLHVRTAKRAAAQELVMRHSVDRTVAHFKKKAMKLQHKRLANGELEIMAQEPPASSDDGTAKMSTVVHRDGRVSIDVTGVRGNRCEQLVHEYAEALEGNVTEVHHKDAYHQHVRVGGNTRV